MDLRQNAELLMRVSDRFRALGDETRLRLMIALREGEKNVTALTDELGIGQASASKHLALLRQAGLVDMRREGAQSIYFVRDQSVYDMCDVVCGSVMRQLEAQFASLGLKTKTRK